MAVSDAHLLEAVRAGDEGAFTQLYIRHRAAAHRVACSYAQVADADELVDDAFHAVLNALRNGGGPTESFRAYLFVTLRRLAKRRQARGPDAPPDQTLDAVQSHAVEPSVLDDLPDRHLVVAAFESLPTQWRTVLWHTAVEGRGPREVASELGLSPNATAALAYRAREGLRQAYLQAHLRSASVLSRCAPHRSRLGAYVRGGLSGRSQTAVETHVHECEACQALAGELREINHLLVRAVAPIAVPGLAAIGFLLPHRRRIWAVVAPIVVAVITAAVLTVALIATAR